MKKNQTTRQIFARKVAPVVIASAVTAVTMFAYYHRTIVLNVSEDTVDKMRDGLSARYDTRTGKVWVHMNEHR